MKSLNTIFIVDNTVNLNIIGHKLESELSCKVVLFTNAEDCLNSLEKQRPDLVLSDYFLDPELPHQLNGDRLLKKIKLKHPNLPVILYSSMASISLTINLMRNGATDFVPRDRNFANKIVSITAFNIRKMRERIEERNAKITILSTITIIIMLLFLTVNIKEDILPYLALSLLAVGILITVLNNPLSKLFNKK